MTPAKPTVSHLPCTRRRRRRADPQFSISTSGSSLRLLEREYYRDQELRQVRNVVIPAWYNREGYVAAMARLIAERCDRFEDSSSPHVFFSAHGLPLKYIEDVRSTLSNRALPSLARGACVAACHLASSAVQTAGGGRARVCASFL